MHIRAQERTLGFVVLGSIAGIALLGLLLVLRGEPTGQAARAELQAHILPVRQPPTPLTQPPPTEAPARVSPDTTVGTGGPSPPAPISYPPPAPRQPRPRRAQQPCSIDFGSISVTASWAHIFVNGQYVGTGRVNLYVPPGSYTVELQSIQGGGLVNVGTTYIAPCGIWRISKG